MSAVRKDGSRWVIGGCEHPEVIVAFDYAVSFSRGDGLAIRIEELLTLRSPVGVTVDIDPGGDVEALAPLLQLVRSELTSGVAGPDGSLELLFASGWSITVAPSDSFEAWNLNAPDGLHLASLPGGGLFEWQHTPRAGDTNK